MSEKVTKEVTILDSDHIWIDGEQFISFNRLLEIKQSCEIDTLLLNNMVKELTLENNSLKQLLKKKVTIV